MEKINILFVDDEMSILQGYKRIFHSMKDVWTLYIAISGQEALKVLSETQLDIIVTDMRMPGMDGTQLLVAVKNKYPHIVRLILSGFTDKEGSLKASGLAHQVLVKPTNADELKACIMNIFRLRGSLTDGTILSVITGTDKLPSRPELYEKLSAEINSPFASVKSIAEIISKDPPMTAKILQMVNSAFFGLPHKIGDPAQAVSFLGLDIVKSLVLVVKVFTDFKGDNNPELSNFWEHSITVGRLAEAICREEGLSKKVSEAAFIAGMMHDLGKLVMSRIPGYLKYVEQEMKYRGISFVDAEYLLWGNSHAEAGSYLLSLWGLPQEIIDVLNYHHFPLRSENKMFSILTAVHIAECFENNVPANDEYIRLLGLEDKIENYKNLMKVSDEDDV